MERDLLAEEAVIPREGDVFGQREEESHVEIAPHPELFHPAARVGATVTAVLIRQEAGDAVTEGHGFHEGLFRDGRVEGGRPEEGLVLISWGTLPIRTTQLGLGLGLGLAVDLLRHPLNEGEEW